MLFNKTKKVKIIERVRIADSLFKRFKGLMFEKKKNFGFALVFPLEKESTLEASIHMLFVFFPIDVLWLDKNKKVVDKKTMGPFCLNCTPKEPSRFIIELPCGKAEKISVGDFLEWEK